MVWALQVHDKRTHSLGIPAYRGGLPGRVRPRGVCLVQRGPGLAVKPYHQGGYAKGPRAPALRVLLLDAGDPPREVVHLHSKRQISSFETSRASRLTDENREAHSCQGLISEANMSSNSSKTSVSKALQIQGASSRLAFNHKSSKLCCEHNII